MTVIENALPGEWIYALGWTVLHSFWQAALIALIIGLLLLRMQERSAAQRYWVAHAGWFSMLICAVVTFFSYYQPMDSSTLITTTRLTPGGEAALLASPSLLGSYLQLLKDYFNEHLPLVVSLWALGVTFFLLRFLGGLIFLQHLRTYKVQPLSPFWESKMTGLAQQLRLRRPVQLLESALVKVPMVIGWVKPVILLPIGALNALSPQQVEAVLAHELAHIKRHDYLLNVIRSLVEVLFYFNPAVWWLSAQIRREREHCCDDMALAVCGDSLSYVRALVALQELSKRPGAGLAMTLVRSKPELLNRVRRILNQPKDKSDLMEKVLISCLLLLGLSFTLISAGNPEEEIDRSLFTDSEITVTPNVTSELPVSRSIRLDDLANREHRQNVVLELKSLNTVAQIHLDTVPEGNISLKTKKDGKVYDVQIKKQKIEKLSINGKPVPEEELINYYDVVQRLLDDMPPPPPPPAPVQPKRVSVPEPPTPPTPPAPVVAPSPSAPTAVPAPPTPPTPPAPSAAAPPPLPPRPDRIKLQKPEKREGGRTGSFQDQVIEVPAPEPAEANHFVWNSSSAASGASVWVADPDQALPASVIKVRVRKEEDPSASDQQILVEVIAEPGQDEFNFTTADAVSLPGNPTATFYRRTAAGSEPANVWQAAELTEIFPNTVVDSVKHYQIEISRNQLLIDGQSPSKEDKEKYLFFLQRSSDQSSEGKELRVFDHRSKRKIE